MAKLPNITIQTIQANGKVVGEQVFSSKNITLDALDNSSFKLIDETGKAPDSIITQKQGDDLVIKLSNQANQPTITINDFYSAENSQLVGTNASGELYPYNLASSNVETNSLLAEHVVTSESSFTFNPWYVLGGAVAVGGVALAAGGGGSSSSSSGGSGGSSSSGNNSEEPYIDLSFASRSVGVSGNNYGGLDFLISDKDSPKGVDISSPQGTLARKLIKFDETSDYGFSIEKSELAKIGDKSTIDLKVNYANGSSLSKSYNINHKNSVSGTDFTDANDILIFNKLANNTVINTKQGYDSLIYKGATTSVTGISVSGDNLEHSDMRTISFDNSNFNMNNASLNIGNLTNSKVVSPNLGLEAKDVSSSEIIHNGTNKGYFDLIELGNVSNSKIKLSEGHSTLTVKNLEGSTIELGDGFDALTINKPTANIEGNLIDGGKGRDVLILENNSSSDKFTIDSSQFKNIEWIEANGLFEINIKYSDLANDSGRDGALNILASHGFANRVATIVFAEPEKWEKVGVKNIIYKPNNMEEMIAHKLYGSYADDEFKPEAFPYDQYHYTGANGSRNDVFIDQDLTTNII